jgi:hypothetical protein
MASEEQGETDKVPGGGQAAGEFGGWKVVPEERARGGGWYLWAAMGAIVVMVAGVGVGMLVWWGGEVERGTDRSEGQAGAPVGEVEEVGGGQVLEIVSVDEMLAARGGRGVGAASSELGSGGEGEVSLEEVFTGAVSEGPREIEEIEVPSVGQQALATYLIERFLSSDDLEVRSGLVLGGERVKGLMGSYRERPTGLPDRWGQQPGAMNRYFLGRGEQRAIVMQFEQEGLLREAVLLEQEDGGYRLDWEAYVGHSDLPWDVLRESRPEEAVVLRCYLLPDEYYNFGFGDAERWACFRLDSPDNHYAVYGYVERGSELERRLRDTLPLGGGARPASLEVAYPEGGGRAGNQVEIIELLGSGWSEFFW